MLLHKHYGQTGFDDIIITEFRTTIIITKQKRIIQIIRNRTW